jgi:hypothetical protein
MVHFLCSLLFLPSFSVYANNNYLEDSPPLGCDAVLLGKHLPMFQRHYHPSQCQQPLTHQHSVTLQKTWILQHCCENKKSQQTLLKRTMTLCGCWNDIEEEMCWLERVVWGCLVSHHYRRWRKGTGLAQSNASLKRGLFLETLTPTVSEHSYPLPSPPITLPVQTPSNHPTQVTHFIPSYYFHLHQFCTLKVEAVRSLETVEHSTFIQCRPKTRPSFEQCSVWSDYRAQTGMHRPLCITVQTSTCSHTQVSNRWLHVLDSSQHEAVSALATCQWVEHHFMWSWGGVEV